MIAKSKEGKSQVERFKKAARELGCDESEERFDDALKRVAKSTQSKPDKPTPKKPDR